MTDATEARRKLREIVASHQAYGDCSVMVQLSDLRSALAAEPSPAPLPADVEEVVRGLEETHRMVTARLAEHPRLLSQGNIEQAITLLRAQAAAIAEQVAEIRDLLPFIGKCADLTEQVAALKKRPTREAVEAWGKGVLRFGASQAQKQDPVQWEMLDSSVQAETARLFGETP